MEDLAREAESAASNQGMGQIYQVTKQLSGKEAQVNMPIKDKKQQYTDISSVNSARTCLVRDHLIRVLLDSQN